MATDSQKDRADTDAAAVQDMETVKESKEARGGRLILLGIACVIVLAFVAIAVGLMINDDGGGMPIREVFATWMEGFSRGKENEERFSAPCFPTQSAGTVRGDMCAVGEDGSLFLLTGYGVCRVGKEEGGYQYNGWAMRLDGDLSVSTMAVYDDCLYLACGEDGMYRVDTTCSNTPSKIIDADVTSFVIAEDRLFYLSMDRARPETGELYTAGLDGIGSESLGENVRHAAKYLSCADLVYRNGYLYYFDEEDNLKRMRAKADAGAGIVVERERQKRSFESCGLYENGGILYLPSRGGGIYSYDVEEDRLRKVTDAENACDAPLLFAGDALLYCPLHYARGEGLWRQIIGGEDTIYGTNYGMLWMQAVGEEELITFHEPQDGYYTQSGYHAVSFSNGNIRAEEPVVIDYDEMPEVEIGENPADIYGGNREADCRASHFVFIGPNGSSVYDRYAILMIAEKDEWYEGTEKAGLIWTYTDGDGEHSERLVEGEVGTFFVEDDILYYTLWDKAEEHYELYVEDLSERAGARLLLENVKKEFECRNGMIFYVDAGDGGLYQYHVQRETNKRISEDAVGCYDIYDGMIYYEKASDSTIWRMRTDGTEAEMLFPLGGGALCQFKVCPYGGSIYIAITMNPNYVDTGIYLFSEDGWLVLVLTRNIGNYDRRQTLYFMEDRLYYSAGFACEIRVFDFERYFEGGSEIRADYEAYDSSFCSENMYTFEVTDEWVYVRMFMNTSRIKVFDRQTGELIGEIDCERLGDY